MRKRGRNLTAKHLQRARMLRQEMSLSERYMWNILRDRNLGFKFRRQHPLGDYVLDFYCAEALLNIETDGEQHRTTQARDRLRDREIERHGILTVRIPTLDLHDPVAEIRMGWRDRIVAICRERSEMLARSK